MLLNNINFLNVWKTSFTKQPTELCSQLLILHTYVEVFTMLYSSFKVLHEQGVMLVSTNDLFHCFLSALKYINS